MVEADIHLKPLHTSILDMYKMFETLECCLNGIWLHPYHYTGQVFLSFGNSFSLEEWKNCHKVMVEADIHLQPLHTSMLVMYKVFETLVCCLNGIWLHSYTITLATLTQDFGIQVHLRSGNDATTSWLRLTFTSNCFTHPY